MSEPFELFGISGLLLPGSEERPCPWVNKYEGVQNIGEQPDVWWEHVLVIAACWAYYAARVQEEPPPKSFVFTPSDNALQAILWSTVYLEAERRINEKH